ncbi:protein lethal(2)essential for life-like [Cydia strobilella]|uniref:protein lethal(2)essential for life-like n=1 Tax=Cydia strobilella TaxID=1100964 RepID=UPI0030061B09
MKTFSAYTNTFIFLIIIGANLALAEEKCGEKSERRDLYRRRNSLFDQDFGLEFAPGDFLTSMFFPFSFHDYYRPWRHLASISRDVGSTIKTDKDQFQINLDVQHFSPDEITVKTLDGYVVVEGKHEEKEDDHGFVSRQFVRRYSLPEGVEPEKVVSQLSSDGVLTVSAPMRLQLENTSERVVPITQTGPIRKEIKEIKESPELPKNPYTESCEKDSCSKKN